MMLGLKSTLHLTVLLSIFLPLARACEENIIYVDNVTGSDVVEAVITELDSLGIFTNSDNCLLRRIAFVETCDGDDHLPPGGIWALDEVKFNVALIDPKLKILLSLIPLKLQCKDNETVAIRYANMKKPLISGLMSRFFLEHLAENVQSIPESTMIEGQADFWFDYYYNHRGNLTREDFIRLVGGTEGDDSGGSTNKREDSAPEAQQVDLTFESNANGSDVVNAVIAKLDASNIFGPDHRFLRRLAYVESRDGADIVTFINSEENSGIWGLEQCKFHLLQRVLLNQTNEGVIVDEKMFNISRYIILHFHINTSALHTRFLDKPLLSGLVARLYLYYLTVAKDVYIPLAGDIEEQAQFWLTHYHPDTRGITIQIFIDKVSQLEKEEGCLVNADIFFVLDVSGSVGEHLSKATEFVYDFVDKLTIGPEHNQVGIILFNTTAKTLFTLNTHENRDDLLTAIKGVKNLTASGRTNIIDGLCKLIDGFKETNGARPASSAIFRIVIMLSDGKSNEHDTSCNLSSNTGDAAGQVRELLSPVLVYVIGITDKVNDDELRSIATPGSYTHIASFNHSLLKDTQEEHADSVCRRASLPLNSTEEVNGTLSENEMFRYNLQIPYIGITVIVCVFEGRVQVYGSLSIVNPSSALHDFYLDVELEGEGVCGEMFVPGCSTPSSDCLQSHPTKSKRQIHQTATPQQPHPFVYLSIVGKATVNSFALTSTHGDHIFRNDLPRVKSPTPTPIPTTIPPGPGSNHKRGEAVAIALPTICGFLIVVVSLIITVYVCHRWFVGRRKKKRETEQEYHRKLLDMKQNAEYNEYDNVLY